MWYYANTSINNKSIKDLQEISYSWGFDELYLFRRIFRPCKKPTWEKEKNPMKIYFSDKYTNGDGIPKKNKTSNVGIRLNVV